MKLRDVAILLASTQLNLTNEDIARGIAARKPGATHGLAAGNVTRSLDRVNDAVKRLFEVRVVSNSEQCDRTPPELATLPAPPPEVAAAAEPAHCPFCHSRQIVNGLCLGCGSDV